LREGGSTLFPEEIELLGDVKGKRLLHLQCNAGQDTLSLAARLRADVTGVDISDEAIAFARTLAQDSGISGTFVRSDIYDWLARNEDLYDVVFVSYGAIMWLSDIVSWAKGIAKALNPGGRLVLIEFHPLIGLLDGALTADWKQANDYMGGTHYRYEVGVGDYVAEAGGSSTNTGQTVANDTPWQNPHPSHEFSWGVGEVVSALINAGLRITALHEYPYCNGFKPYPSMLELPGRRMKFSEDMPLMPLMFAVCANKP
jgi:SAM-dependent methyltransferase